MGNPPSYEGAVKVTDTEPLLKALPFAPTAPESVAVPTVGALGTTRLDECVPPTIGILSAQIANKYPVVRT